MIGPALLSSSAASLRPRAMAAADPHAGAADGRKARVSAAAAPSPGPSLAARLARFRERLAPKRAVAPAAPAAPAPAPAPAEGPRAAADPAHPQQPPKHLIVLINGLFGSPDNWTVAAAALAAEMGGGEQAPAADASAAAAAAAGDAPAAGSWARRTLQPPPLILVSAANARAATYDGIDVCGQRLADEVRRAVAARPSLERVSIVGHSMGGLLGRYLAGALYDPRAGTVAGLRPAHFLTLATPFLGCDVGEGVSQVPFLGWAGRLLPGPGAAALRGIAAPVAGALLGRTGRQFFLEDGGGPDVAAAARVAAAAAASGGGGGGGKDGAGGQDRAEQGGEQGDQGGDLPLLARMARDDPSRGGLRFHSALAAFRTRTCYANVRGDHLVGWANASLRPAGALPPPPPRALLASRYIVREDPPAAAFSAGDPAAAAGAAVAAAGLAAGVAAGAGTGPGAAGTTTGRGGGGGAGNGAAPSWHAEEGAMSPRAREAEVAAAVELAAAAVAAARGGGGGGEASSSAHAPPAAAAGAPEAAPAGARGAAAGDLAAGLHPLVGMPQPGRAAMVADMLLRLGALPWRRVDVCFRTGGGGGEAAPSAGRGGGSSSGGRGGVSGGGGGGGPASLIRGLGLAHNNIQVTRRLLNSEGEAVVAHVARTLRELDDLLLAAEEGEQGER